VLVFQNKNLGSRDSVEHASLPVTVFTAVMDCHVDWDHIKERWVKLSDSEPLWWKYLNAGSAKQT